MGASIDSKVSILLSINFFILEYSFFDNSKYLLKQILAIPVYIFTIFNMLIILFYMLAFSNINYW